MQKLTFPAYHAPCGWNAMLPARAPRAAANGSLSVKYAVVGAGFTGFAAARRLAELDPGADIMVLEATTVGEGSSARNSGFLAPADIAGSIDASAVEKNNVRNRYVAEGFTDLLTLVQQHKIDCNLHLAGRIKAAATQHGEKSVHDLLKIVRALNIPHHILDRGQLRERIGTDYYRVGVFTEVGHLVQPAALIRGLADALPARVQIYENTPVVALEKRGKWHLQTPNASVSADVVIMATNASIKNFGYLADRLVTIYTHAAITRTLSANERASLGAMQTWGLLPAHRLGSTLRRVGEDRLLVRSLYSYEHDTSAHLAREQLLASFHRRWPELRHVDFDHAWSGVTALTMNGAPTWGKVDDGLYVSAGCNGSGIVKGTVLGKRLADFASRQSVEADLLEAYGSANWIAPEPFRTIGFHAISAFERRKAGLEA